MNTKRPLSPHLQIYKPQLTSVLSISHRITGVILSIFSILIPIFLLFLSLGADYYNLLLRIMDNFFIKVILAGTIFVVVYHKCSEQFWKKFVFLDVSIANHNGVQ